MKEIHPAIIWVPIGDVMKTYKSVHQEPSRWAECSQVNVTSINLNWRISTQHQEINKLWFSNSYLIQFKLNLK